MGTTNPKDFTGIDALTVVTIPVPGFPLETNHRRGASGERSGRAQSGPACCAIPTSLARVFAVPRTS